MPPQIASYLWDVPMDTLDVHTAAPFIIERVLEYGNSEDIAWLEKTYKKDQITTVLKESKRISVKTATFYCLRYKINKGEVECFRKPFTQKQHRF